MAKKEPLQNFYFNKNIFLSNVEKVTDEYTEYTGTYKSVLTKFRLYKDNKIYIQSFCIKCGNEFYYEYNVKRPNLLCENCKNNKSVISPVEEIIINNRVFIKYSNGMIRPK